MVSLGRRLGHVTKHDPATVTRVHVYTMLVENARYRLLIRFLVKAFAFDPRRFSLERLYAQASYCLSSDQS